MRLLHATAVTLQEYITCCTSSCISWRVRRLLDSCWFCICCFSSNMTAPKRNLLERHRRPIPPPARLPIRADYLTQRAVRHHQLPLMPPSSADDQLARGEKSCPQWHWQQK